MHSSCAPTRNVSQRSPVNMLDRLYASSYLNRDALQEYGDIAIEVIGASTHARLAGEQLKQAMIRKGVELESAEMARLLHDLVAIGLLGRSRNEQTGNLIYYVSQREVREPFIKFAPGAPVQWTSRDGSGRTLSGVAVARIKGGSSATEVAGASSKNFADVVEHDRLLVRDDKGRLYAPAETSVRSGDLPVKPVIAQSEPSPVRNREGEQVEWTSRGGSGRTLSGRVVAAVKAGQSIVSLTGRKSKNFSDTAGHDRLLVADDKGCLYAPSEAAVRQCVAVPTASASGKRDFWAEIECCDFLEAMEKSKAHCERTGETMPVETMRRLLARADTELRYQHMLRNSVARLLNTRPAQNR